MDDVELAETRLDNIRAVKPILSALRTISLGSWQSALRRRDYVRRYEERLAAMLPVLVPHVQPRSLRNPLTVLRSRHDESSPASARVTALVIGSERGLCGRFNQTVVERAERYLVEQEAAGAQIELGALGTHATRIIRRRGWPLAWSGVLSVTSLPRYSLALDLTRKWLNRYEARELGAVDLIYNVYRGTARSEPTVVRLIPPQLPPTGRVAHSSYEPWAPPIIETDPLGLYARLIEQWASARLYTLLLESAAAEHSARFQLLEGATQNAKQIIAELTLAIQAARQQAITREMQELAAGAGLVGTAPD